MSNETIINLASRFYCDLEAIGTSDDETAAICALLMHWQSGGEVRAGAKLAEAVHVAMETHRNAPIAAMG